MKTAIAVFALASAIDVLMPSYVITSCTWQKYTQTHYACGSIDIFVPPNGTPALQMNELTGEKVELVIRKYK